VNVAYKQVSLLPWLQLTDIQIGNALFWKYDSTAVSNPKVKDYLDNYVKCYVNKHQEPVETITVVSYKDKNYFEPLSDEEYQELNFARNILCFLCVEEQSRIALVGNNNSIGPASADILRWFLKTLYPGQTILRSSREV